MTMRNITVEGIILAIEDQRILVAKNVDEERVKTLDFNKTHWLDEGLNLTYYRYEGNLKRLKVGDRIGVVTNGIEAMSYPGQAAALRIIKRRAKK